MFESLIKFFADKQQLVVDLKKDKYSILVKKISVRIISELNGDKFSERVWELLAHMDTTGRNVPFILLDEDPDQISQIKKIINALYHAEKALVYLEAHNFKDVVVHITKAKLGLPSDIIEHVYQASMLATHLDIDLGKMFREELALLTGGGCSLIKMTTLPTCSSINAIASELQGKDAIVLYNNELFYADQNEVNKVELNDSNRVNFEKLKAKFTDVHRLADVDELTLITAVTGRSPSGLTVLQTYAINYSKDTKRFLSHVDPAKIPHQIGIAAGTVVNLMGPKDGEVDYKFITDISAVIPEYLNKLSRHIQTFTNGVAAHQPSIDKKQLNALKNESLQLLEALEGVRSSQAFTPLKILRFIHIIRHTITLSQSIFEQIGLLNASSQDYALDLFTTLKKPLLELFLMADKIESALLRPGVLSNPLMAAFSMLYQALTGYAGKVVDFSRKGQHLITLEDSAFVSARLAGTFNRIASDHREHILMGEAELACRAFFACLNEERKDCVKLIDLPEATRNRLAIWYKTIEPYVLKLDIPLNNAIISGLTGEKTFLDDHPNLRWLVSYEKLSKISYILDQAPKLKSQFIKANHTFEFNDRLNDDIAQSVSKNIHDLKLFAVDTTNNPFDMSALDTQLADLENVNIIDVLKSFKLYQKKCLELEFTNNAFNEFYSILMQADVPNSPYNTTFGEGARQKLRNLYGVFQSYLVCGATLAIDPELLKKLDKAIIDVLSSTGQYGPGADVGVIAALNHAMVAALSVPVTRASKTVLESKITLLTDFKRKVLVHFDTVKGVFVEKCGQFGQKFRELNAAKIQEKTLVPDLLHVPRAHHLIKHEHYSKAIGKFRDSVFALTRIFNDSIKRELISTEADLPYPELKDAHEVLAQGSQVLGLKQSFNCLYYLEQISLNLEKLSDDSPKVEYVKTILEIVAHMGAVKKLVQALMTNPSLYLISNEIRQQLQLSYVALKKARQYYFPGPEEDEFDSPPVEHNAVFFVLNAIMIIPAHIRALRAGNDLSAEQAQKINQHAEKVNNDIERILKKSSSYFKLFFEIPAMYRMFKDLKGKIEDLSHSTHEAVSKNLAAIHDVYLGKMILEADLLEHNLGLGSGTLSAPLKDVFDTFFQGLLEPLGLPSKIHMALVASLSPIEQRERAAEKQIRQAKDEQDALNAKSTLVRNLLARIQSYNKACQISDSMQIAQQKALMTDAYTMVLPTLIEEKANLVSIVPKDLDHSKFERPHEIAAIESFAKACFSYFKGLHVTQTLSQKSAKEKVTFLEKLKLSEIDRVRQYRADYTKAIFDTHCLTLSTRQVGLIHCVGEYNAKLTSYMKSAEEEIIAEAIKSDDIQQKMGELLKSKRALFEIKNYKDHYHLDRILSSIEELNLYLSKMNKYIAMKSSYPEKQRATMFENTATRLLKFNIAIELKNIATDLTLPINERLLKLKDKIEDPVFKTRILKTHSHDAWSFAWFLRGILSLLELLRLYTPDHKKCYNNLIKEAVAPTAAHISHLSHQFGLFYYKSEPLKKDSKAMQATETSRFNPSPA